MDHENNSQFSTLNSPVPKGYKQTEIGVIPEDWVLNYVSAIATTVASGKSHVNSEFGNYPVYGSTGIIGRSTQNDYSGKAILIARVGANAGKLSVVDGEYGVTDNTVIVRVDGSTHLDYFWRQLEAKRLNSLVFGSGQPLITGTQIKNLTIPFPPTKAEQEAIAEALSDADALIESLTQLIAKKRQIKQGAMQELLTGKRRLHGFANATIGYKQTEVGMIPEDWEVKSIGEICTYQNGTALESYFNNRDGYLVISIGNYSASGKFVVTGNFIEKRHSNALKKFILRKNDLAMLLNDKTSVGTIIGRVLLIDRDDTYIFNQRTMRLASKEMIDSAFLYFQINSDITHQRVVDLAKPGTQIYVNTGDITDLKIPFPSTKTEQEAIAEVLTDVDTEIAALETKLAKAREIKQGMMHNLLTGRIRLV
jgi:type I restriction enzyme, S subunit